MQPLVRKIITYAIYSIGFSFVAVTSVMLAPLFLAWHWAANVNRKLSDVIQGLKLFSGLFKEIESPPTAATAIRRENENLLGGRKAGILELFSQLFNEAMGVYNVSLLASFDKLIDEEILRQALDDVQSRYAILHTKFVGSCKTGYELKIVYPSKEEQAADSKGDHQHRQQVTIGNKTVDNPFVGQSSALPLRVVYKPNLNEYKRLEYWARLLEEEVSVPFPPEAKGLARCILVQPQAIRTSNQHRHNKNRNDSSSSSSSSGSGGQQPDINSSDVVLTMDHSLVDGATIYLIYQDIISTYARLVKARSEEDRAGEQADSSNGASTTSSLSSRRSSLLSETANGNSFAFTRVPYQPPRAATIKPLDPPIEYFAPLPYRILPVTVTKLICAIRCGIDFIKMTRFFTWWPLQFPFSVPRQASLRGYRSFQERYRAEHPDGSRKVPLWQNGGVFDTLTPEETKAFLAACKQHRTTATSALWAALAIAQVRFAESETAAALNNSSKLIKEAAGAKKLREDEGREDAMASLPLVQGARFLDEGVADEIRKKKKRKSALVFSTVNVDMRRRNMAMFKSNLMGVHLSMQFIADRVGGNYDQFWSLAKGVYRKQHKFFSLRSLGKYWDMIWAQELSAKYIIDNISCTLDRPAHSMLPSFNLSNLGVLNSKFQTGPNKDDPADQLTITRVHAMVTTPMSTPMIIVLCATVNNVLCLSFVFCKDSMTEDAVRRYATEVKNAIRAGTESTTTVA